MAVILDGWLVISSDFLITNGFQARHRALFNIHLLIPGVSLCLNIIYHLNMNRNIINNQRLLTGVRTVLCKVGVFSVRLAIVLLCVFRELFGSTETRHDNERRLHDSNLSGELNHRTGQLDAGTDPYGWYDN